jgi:delta 1-pyrroline-5-carboxylate dehydrogenase
MGTNELQAIKDRAGINLLAYIVRSTLEHGYDAVTVDRLNDVILLTEGKVIDPKTFKELEVM